MQSFEATRMSAGLVENARDGDEASRNVLATICLRYLRRLAYEHFPRRALAGAGPEDVVQETLLRGFRRLDAFVPRSEGSFLRYLRTILLNLIAAARRESRRRPESLTAAEEIPCRAPTPVQEIVRRETWAEYRRAATRLPRRQKTAVSLFVEFGLSFGEIAAALNSPTTNAARMVVTRGLRRLAELMPRSPYARSAVTPPRPGP